MLCPITGYLPCRLIQFMESLPQQPQSGIVLVRLAPINTVQRCSYFKKPRSGFQIKLVQGITGRKWGKGWHDHAHGGNCRRKTTTPYWLNRRLLYECVSFENEGA